MNGTILKNVVRFTGLVLNTPTSLPHLLNLNGIATTPRLVLQGNSDGTAGGFTVTVDATTITVMRTASSSGDAVDIYTECWHTIEEVLPPGGVAAPFVAAGGGGGGGDSAVIFDDSVPGDDSNIRSNRLIHQSAIANIFTQITNLGSQDGSANPAATGATAIGATIIGGVDGTASGDYSTVLGGAGNSALGNYSVAEGHLSQATDAAAHAEGESTLATAPGAHSEGSNTQAAAQSAHAEGTATQALGQNSHAEGSGTIASNPADHAEGIGTAASGIASHSEGESTIASARNAHAEGFTTTASGRAAHSEGTNTLSDGDNCHAEGDRCKASFDSSHAQGVLAHATRAGQHSIACGAFSVAGDAQASVLVLRGTTPGLGAAETVELVFGAGGINPILFEDGKAYAVKVVAVVGGVQGGPVRKQRSLEISFGVRCDAGLTVITGSGAPASYGDAAASTWLITASVGVAPDRLVLTFTTGVGANSACSVVARVEFIEASY